MTYTPPASFSLRKPTLDVQSLTEIGGFRMTCFDGREMRACSDSSYARARRSR